MVQGLRLGDETRGNPHPFALSLRGALATRQSTHSPSLRARQGVAIHTPFCIVIARARSDRSNPHLEGSHAKSPRRKGRRRVEAKTPGSLWFRNFCFLGFFAASREIILSLRATMWRGNPVGIEPAPWRTSPGLPTLPLDCRVGTLSLLAMTTRKGADGEMGLQSYHSSLKSVQAGLSFSINSNFLLLGPAFNCFSRRIALLTSSKVSK